MDVGYPFICYKDNQMKFIDIRLITIAVPVILNQRDDEYNRFF